jgi:hypothetical protein
MIAIKRLQSIMWILVVAIGALAAYLISLQVATERNAVRHTIDQIRWTRADIRYLEAEFGARASMRQLHAWNSNDLRLYVPAPAQYLPNERALANLDRMTPVEGGYTPPPVMTAMAKGADPVPAPVVQTAEKKEVVKESPASSEFALIRTASAAEPRQAAAAPVLAKKPSAPIAPAPKVAVLDPEVRKASRLALLDEKLLGGSTRGEAKVR